MSLTFDMRAVLMLATMFLLGITLYYGVVFQGSLPDHPILQGKNDLFLHTCAFAALTLPVRLLWPRWPSIAALALCATAIEAVQMLEPRRTAALDDLAASLLGILLAAILVALLQRTHHRISNKNHE